MKTLHPRSVTRGGLTISPEESFQVEKAIKFLITQYSASGKNPKPVIFHSLRTAFYLLSLGYEKDIVIPAVLHDLIEDSDVTLEDIDSAFGKGVATIVSSLTFNPEIKDKEGRNREMFARTKEQGKKALIIKCADIYDGGPYIKLVENKEEELKLVEKMKYFLDLAKPVIGHKVVWKDLEKRYQEEAKRIETSYNP